ncbi:MAG: hypothetical protein H3C69_09010 [Candidatus Promineofilum sp.]|nr:hypothetical protein [Promineifilum sp.]
MTQQISAELFTTNLYALLAETFESVHGIYLDVLEEYMLQTSKGPIDWDSSRQVDAVMSDVSQRTRRCAWRAISICRRSSGLVCNWITIWISRVMSWPIASRAKCRSIRRPEQPEGPSWLHFVATSDIM